jgi:hypothetical protein
MTARVVAIDWSGAKRGAARKIWLPEFRDGRPFDVPWNRKPPGGVRDYLISTCREHPMPSEWKDCAATSDDAFDAIVSAVEMNRNFGELEALKQEKDPNYLIEGRIWQPGKGESAALVAPL